MFYRSETALKKQPVALGKECDNAYVEIAMSRGSSSGPVLLTKI